MPKIRWRRRKKPSPIGHTTLEEQKRMFDKSSKYSQRICYFAWGKVLDRHSEDMTADVLLDNGITLKRVQVRSMEWMGSDSSIGYGERDLPPTDSLVLVAFPYGIIEKGIILCSSFAPYGKLHVDKQKAELLVSSKETEKLRIGESGVKITEEKSNGNYKLELPSGAKLEIIVNTAKIEIDASGGVKVTPASGQSIVLNNGTQGANDFPTCIFSGANHCLDASQTVKVP